MAFYISNTKKKRTIHSYAPLIYEVFVNLFLDQKDKLSIAKSCILDGARFLDRSRLNETFIQRIWMHINLYNNCVLNEYEFSSFIYIHVNMWLNLLETQKSYGCCAKPCLHMAWNETETWKRHYHNW